VAPACIGTSVPPGISPARSISADSDALAITGRANGSTGRAAIGTRGVSLVMTGAACAGTPIGRAA
jgi:hypothetical protein